MGLSDNTSRTIVDFGRAMDLTAHLNWSIYTLDNNTGNHGDILIGPGSRTSYHGYTFNEAIFDDIIDGREEALRAAVDSDEFII